MYPAAKGWKALWVAYMRDPVHKALRDKLEALQTPEFPLNDMLYNAWGSLSTAVHDHRYRVGSAGMKVVVAPSASVTHQVCQLLQHLCDQFAIAYTTDAMDDLP